MTLTTETLNLWRNNAEITAGETAEDDPEHIAAKAILALTAELLANREAQPVFFIEIEGDDWVNAGRIEGENRPDLGLLPDGINYLYTAPPAPAVPDKATPGNIEILASGYSNGTFQLDDDEANLATEIWNACRAAMLAQPVSSGYTLPEGWIACSEQTPVADGAYWGWFGKEKPSVIQQRVCIWNDRNHEWCDSAVTHWMPLPVAPEGGNG